MTTLNDDDSAELKWTMNVNFMAAVYCTREVYKSLTMNDARVCIVKLNWWSLWESLRLPFEMGGFFKPENFTRKRGALGIIHRLIFREFWAIVISIFQKPFLWMRILKEIIRISINWGEKGSKSKWISWWTDAFLTPSPVSLSIYS